MKKIIYVIVLILLTLMVTSCETFKHKETIKVKETTVTIKSETTSTVAITETEKEVANQVDDTEEKKSNRVKSYNINTEIENAQEVVDITKLNMPEKINGHNFWFNSFYDKKTLVVQLFDDTNINEFEKEIGLYNYENNQYTKLVDLDNAENNEDIASYIAKVQDDILIYQLTSDIWKNMSLHYLDISSKKSVKIHDYMVDPNTKSIIWNFDNGIVLKDNKIYFDEYSPDGNGDVRADMYEYDIETGSKRCIREHAQNPFLYNDKLIAIMRNEENKYRILKSIDANDTILNFGDSLTTIAVNSNSVFTMNIVEGCIEDGYKKVNILNNITNSSFLTTDKPVDQLKCSDHFVKWRNFEKEYPIIYCIQEDKLLMFNEIPKGLNDFLLKDTYGILNTIPDYESEREYYFFKLKVEE